MFPEKRKLEVSASIVEYTMALCVTMTNTAATTIAAARTAVK